MLCIRLCDPNDYTDVLEWGTDGVLWILGGVCMDFLRPPLEVIRILGNRIDEARVQDNLAEGHSKPVELMSTLEQKSTGNYARLLGDVLALSCDPYVSESYVTPRVN